MLSNQNTSVARNIFWFLLSFIILLLSGIEPSFSQQKENRDLGQVTGILRDSTHNYFMQAATVAIYNAADNALINYRLSDEKGYFEFNRLPVNIKLKFVASYLGYQNLVKFLTIPEKENKFDLKVLNMSGKGIVLDDVTISGTPPPMQVRGDTIEFNAQAFKLDTNAVVEDMLRKLPGVTVWNDGLITVNGKKINKLLVEGKEFFGGNTKIALQNLAKNAVQKVQVYRDGENKDPINPSTNMNIVLKKDKKDGFFGKLGAGLGTDRRYAHDGMLSYFSPRTQLSAVGTVNNVNKTAGSASVLMGYNSFKGEGIENDYHSDFSKAGMNIFKGGGLNFQHDFSAENDSRPEYLKYNIIKSDYFISKTINQVTRKDETTISLGSSGQLDQIGEYNNEGSSHSERLNGSYKKKFQRSLLDVSFYRNVNKSDQANSNSYTSVNSTTAKRSESSSQTSSDQSQQSNGIAFKLNTERFQDGVSGKMKSVNLDMEYQAVLEHRSSTDNNITAFRTENPSEDKDFNRTYNKYANAQRHSVNLRLADLIGLFQRRQPYFQLDVKNSFSFFQEKEDRDVEDRSASGQSSINSELSNKSNYRTIEDRFGINILKKINRHLDNRYDRNLVLNLFAESQLMLQKNVSDKQFQYLDRTYGYFIPSATLSYNDEHFGDYIKSYQLSYNTSVKYPEMDQLAPLVDYSNVYNIVIGSIGLKPTYLHELTLRYDYTNSSSRTPYLNNLSLSLSQSENFITDSTNYDGLGRSTTYIVNGGQARSVSLQDNFVQAFKLNNQLIQLKLKTNGTYNELPSFVNQVRYTTKSTTLLLAAALIYKYKEFLTTDVGQSFYMEKNIQQGLNEYSISNTKTFLNVSAVLSKGLSLSSRIEFNGTKSSYSDRIRYNIWNADLTYRFLKGANAEVKFSALDILHENKNIFNFVGNDRITRGTANVLQQYFMLTLAYYPRKFGISPGKHH